MNTLKELYRYIEKYRHELIVGAFSILLADILGLLLPWLIKLAIDYIRITCSKHEPSLPFNFSGKWNHLLTYSILIVAVVGLQTIFRYLWRKHLFGISRKIEYDLRNNYFRHLQKLGFGFFQHVKTGDIMSRATNDLYAVREFIGSGIIIIVDSAVIISTCLILMIVISIKLTVISIIPAAAITLIVMKFNREIEKRFESVQKKLSDMYSTVHEFVSGIGVIQAYVQEENELGRFRKHNQQLMKKNIELTSISGIFSPLMVFTTGVTAVIVLWVGGREVMIGHITLGSYVAFNGYLTMLTGPMAAIGFMINLSQRGIASMKRVKEIMLVKPEIYNGLESGTAQSPANTKEIKNSFKGKIEFKSVTFSQDGKSDILFDVNFTIGAGSLLVLTGPIGSGKSTLLRLIPRIYDPSGGSVLIDGTDIKKIPIEALREMIGYVEQEPFLFSDTVRENIVFGAGRISIEEIEDVTKSVELDRDIATFPYGLDTVIGERGVTLSGGQKQRVALARAIIKKPKILILDDAFSNLDAYTEGEVLNNIRTFLKETTIVLISNRVFTIKSADNIVVINEGRIIESGTHDELLSKKGLYSRIYKKHLFSEMGIIEE
jgi:ATP-binding cassette subfamily B protein